MKISVIGSQEAGMAIARGLADLGYDVALGAKDTNKKSFEKVKKEAGKKVNVMSYAAAAGHGGVSILAVAWHSAENVLSLVRPQLSGKIVIDITNPIVYDEDGAPQLAVGHDISGGELVQQTLADSHVVKALNSINYHNIIKPHYKNAVPTAFMCGNNASAKKTVAELLLDFGWTDVQDIGAMDKSRLLEPLSLLWIEYGVSNDTWDHSISMINK